VTDVSVQHYRDLIVWQKGMRLAKMCYGVTSRFPKTELIGMTSQIRRAAASIPANIAEERGRAHTREFRHHLSIARGSLAELETHLILSQEVELLAAEDLRDCLALADEISRMLAALRKSLESRL
jgi:four helix bundle protein